MLDPCTKYVPGTPGFDSYSYEDTVMGRFHVINKTNHELVATIEADEDFFISHLFGAYEDDEDNIILHGLKYDSPEVYTKYTFVQQAIYSDDVAKNMVYR
jgi:carotenoid cleavage dioxygenase-like enzyme